MEFQFEVCPMNASRLRAKKPLQEVCNTTPSFLSDNATCLKSSRPSSSIQVLNYGIKEISSSPDMGPGLLGRQLTARGVRLTQQRCTVLSVIEASPHCRNVGVIHRRARGVDARIHRVTVYRTLTLLKRHGMLAQVGEIGACKNENNCPMAGECNKVQMRCLLCGKSVAFQSGMFGDLTRCVEKDCRFRVASATLDIAGYCQSCRV